MKKIDEKQTRELLKKYAPNNSTFQKVYQHCKAVQKASLAIAQEIKKQGHKIDLNLVKIGSLLHDIGRFQAPPQSEKSLRHGIFGGKIIRKERFPNKYALVCERHIGSGISKKEIIKYKLPLPKKDFLPKSIEEKIIAYADDLVFQNRIATVSEVVRKYKRTIPNPEALKRMIKFHNEIERLRGRKNIIK